MTTQAPATSAEAAAASAPRAASAEKTKFLPGDGSAWVRGWQRALIDFASETD